MRSDTRDDWDWSNGFIPEIFNILRQNASFMVSFEIASEEIDLKEVGDIVLSTNVGHIAARIRRSDVNYRDLTIRCRRISGVETEIHKIRKGFGRWYIYAWALDNRKIKDWILVDLDQFRACGLASKDRYPIPNRDDSTWFFAYTDQELELNNCIVAKHNDRLKADPIQPIYQQKPVQLKLMDEVYLEALKHEAFHHAYYTD